MCFISQTAPVAEAVAEEPATSEKTRDFSAGDWPMLFKAVLTVSIAALTDSESLALSISLTAA